MPSLCVLQASLSLSLPHFTRRRKTGRTKSLFRVLRAPGRKVARRAKRRRPCGPGGLRERLALLRMVVYFVAGTGLPSSIAAGAAAGGRLFVAGGWCAPGSAGQGGRSCAPAAG